MLKTALKIFLVLFIFRVNAQDSQEKYINVNAQVLSAKDSSVVAASVLYIKLPYYDDMGMMESRDASGISVPLLQGVTYNFQIKKQGYREFTQDVDIVGDENDQQAEVFYLEVDEIELIKLENLIFARSSPRISETSFEELNELASWMNENPTVVVQLEGHTDFRGNANANMALSQARVEAVKEYLVDQKVKKARILTKAFGGTQPLSRDDTEEAKALNRRVEVRVVSR